MRARSRGGSDGFEHPRSEEELAALVKRAYREGRQLRVRGAAHSPGHAIYTDPLAGFPNHVDEQVRPAGAGINVMLDRYCGLRVLDGEQKLVEVDAGIHLGLDPSDPTRTSTRENSLLYQLWQLGWMLSATGGISHQTASGFTGTGSSGGSLVRSVNQNLWSMRIIDGTGEIHELSADDEEFHAHAPHLGLLGVVSKIVFKCVDTFDIVGSEAITTPDQCAVDVFGPGDATRKPLAEFLRATEFARVEWWPQRGCERVLVWQAESDPPKPGFEPADYEEFTKYPELAEFAISVLFAVLSNLPDLARARLVLRPSYEQLSDALARLACKKGLGRRARSPDEGPRSSPVARSICSRSRSPRSRARCSMRSRPSSRSSCPSSYRSTNRMAVITPSTSGTGPGMDFRWTTARTTCCCPRRSWRRGSRSAAPRT